MHERQTDTRQPAPVELYLLAHVARALQRDELAVSLYSRLDSANFVQLSAPPDRRIGYDWGLRTLSYLYRGTSLERLGRSDEAARYYGLFLDAWREAEPDLQHYAEQARQGLDRLGRPRR